MSRYIVYTPRYESTYVILDDGTGPSEETCDIWEGEAENPRKAKILAVRHWRAEHRRQGWCDCWVARQEGDDKNPFSGLRVEAGMPEAKEGT